MPSSSQPGQLAYSTALTGISTAVGLARLLGGGAAALNFSISEGPSGIVISFTGFDTPEKLTKLGGTQKFSTHEFPGGIKTLQTLGAFPYPINWSGTLIGFVNGQSPIQRALQMDLIRKHGLSVTLAYGGQISLVGVVTAFSYEIIHQNRITYTWEFEPVTDNTTQTTSSSTSTNGGLFNNALASVKTFVSNIASNVLPADTFAALSNLGTTGTLAITAAGGVLSAMTLPNQSSVLLAAGTASTLLQRDSQNPNVAISSQASGLVGSVETIQNTVGNAAGTQQVVNVINPNFVKLAAKYYNDATMWPTIAQANGTFDTQMMGIVAITIPAVNNA